MRYNTIRLFLQWIRQNIVEPSDVFGDISLWLLSIIGGIFRVTLGRGLLFLFKILAQIGVGITISKHIVIYSERFVKKLNHSQSISIEKIQETKESMGKTPENIHVISQTKQRRLNALDQKLTKIKKFKKIIENFDLSGDITLGVLAIVVFAGITLPHVMIPVFAALTIFATATAIAKHTITFLFERRVKRKKRKLKKKIKNSHLKILNRLKNSETTKPKYRVIHVEEDIETNQIKVELSRSNKQTNKFVFFSKKHFTELAQKGTFGDKIRKQYTPV